MGIGVRADSLSQDSEMICLPFQKPFLPDHVSNFYHIYRSDIKRARRHTMPGRINGPAVLGYAQWLEQISSREFHDGHS